MQILHLELENVKSYAHARIPFTEGVNAIVGHNGAGKSTILEAIGYALFDNLAYKASEFVREGATSGRVAVVFLSDYDERPYRVERRFGGSNLHVVYDQELQAKVCEGKVDVLRFVRRHTGADPAADLNRLFGDAIGVAQGTLTSVFLQTPANRKGTFDALLQVDEYKTVFDRLLEPRRLLRERQQGLEVQMAALSSRLERLPALETVAVNRAVELVASDLRLADVTAQLDTVQSRRQALEELREQVEALALRQAAAAGQVEALVGQLRTAERSLAEAQQARQVVTANLGGHDVYLAAQASQAELDKRVRQRQALLGRQAEADKTVALSNAELQRLVDNLAEIARAEAAIVKLAPAVAEQADLEQALATARQDALQRANVDQQIVRLQQQAVTLQQRRDLLTAQLARTPSLEASVRQVEHDIAGLRAAIDHDRVELAQYRVEAEAIKQQSATLADIATAVCPTCEQPLTPAHRTAMLARNDQRLAELRLRHGEGEAKLKRADADMKAREEEQKRLNQELRALPRPDELENILRTLENLAREQETALTTRQALDAAPVQVEALTTGLEALGNPRQQSILAAQQAAKRPAVEQQLAQVREQTATAHRQLAAIEQELTNFADLDDAMAAVAADLAAHQSAYQTVLSHRRLADGVETLAAAAAGIRDEIVQAEIVAGDLAASLTNARARFDPAEYEQFAAKEKMLRNEQGGLQTRGEMLRSEQARDEAEIAALRAQQADLEVLQTERQTLIRQDQALESIRATLKQAGPYITQAVIRQVSSGAEQIFGELMQDFSRQLHWNDDYGISLDVDGVSRQFMQLSGGEQMSAALAVRLALVREMSRIDIAFFDEPTANLDEARREALARQIMQVKGFRQLFVISHDDTFEQATQNLIRVRRQGSISVVESPDGD